MNSEYITALVDWKMKRAFPEYPNIDFDSFIITATINETIYERICKTQIECLPNECFVITENRLVVDIHSICVFIDYNEILQKIISIIYNLDAVEISFNSVGLSLNNSMLIYIYQFLAKKYDCVLYSSQDESEQEFRYSLKKLDRNEKTVIHREAERAISVADVFGKYRDSYLQNIKWEYFLRTDDEIIIVVEDSVIFYFGTPLYDMYPCEIDHRYTYVLIQELTFNPLVKIDTSKFIKSFKVVNTYFDYARFSGHLVPKGPDDYHYYSFESIAKRFPELKLYDRYENAKGELYHFVVFEFKSIDGRIAYAIGKTKGSVLSYARSVCRSFDRSEQKALSSAKPGATLYAFGTRSSKVIGFYTAFASWKNKSTKWRTENIISYYSVDLWIKDENDVESTMKQVYYKATNGCFDGIEKSTYTKALGKWKNEEAVYSFVKKLYSKYQVIYQYRPYFLHTETGQLSYDIYICGKRIAIEYQGKQHFEPVEYFGGEEAFTNQVERDKRKRRLSEENGITLIYFLYNENITLSLVKDRIDEVIANMEDK